MRKALLALFLLTAPALADAPHIEVIGSSASSTGSRQSPVQIDLEVKNTGDKASEPVRITVHVTLVSSEMRAPDGTPAGMEPKTLTAFVPGLDPGESTHAQVNTFLSSDHRFNTKERTFMVLNPNIATLHMDVRYDIELP